MVAPNAQRDASALDPVQCRSRVRPAVDEVAEGEEAIAAGFEADLVEQARERRKLAVDVAGDEVAAGRVWVDGGMRFMGGLYGCRGRSNIRPLSDAYPRNRACSEALALIDRFSRF